MYQRAAKPPPEQRLGQRCGNGSVALHPWAFGRTRVKNLRAHRHLCAESLVPRFGKFIDLVPAAVGEAVHEDLTAVVGVCSYNVQGGLEQRSIGRGTAENIERVASD